MFHSLIDQLSSDRFHHWGTVMFDPITGEQLCSKPIIGYQSSSIPSKVNFCTIPSLGNSHVLPSSGNSHVLPSSKTFMFSHHRGTVMFSLHRGTVVFSHHQKQSCSLIIRNSHVLSSLGNSSVLAVIKKPSGPAYH